MERYCQFKTSGLLSIYLVMGIVSLVQAEGEWYTKIKTFGDIRYRIEDCQEETTTGYNYRDRQVIRARLGLAAVVAEGWKANLRITTGGTEQISCSQTLGTYFVRLPIGFDLAGLEYQVVPELATLSAGKIENPFERAGRSQLIWSADVTMDGIGGKAKVLLLPDLTVYSNLGGFWVSEKSNGVDPVLYGGQLGVRAKAIAIQWQAGASYYYYKDLQGYKTFVNGKSYGNSVDDNNGYLYPFKLGEGYLEAAATIAEFPCKVYGDYVLNNGATTQNVGYLIGLVFNQAKAVNTWELEYNYRRVERDAVIGAFSDSTFLGGATNGSGHLVTIAYILTENVKMNMNFYRDQKPLNDSANPARYHNIFQFETYVSF